MKSNSYGSGINLKFLGLFIGINVLFSSKFRIKMKNNGIVSILILNKHLNFPVEI